jgi:hypothetical protein
VCGHGAGGRRVGLDEKGLLGHGEEWAADGCGVRCSEHCVSFAHRFSCVICGEAASWFLFFAHAVVMKDDTV